MLPEAEGETELEREVGLERALRHERDRLRLPLALDDVPLPVVCIHVGPGGLLQDRAAAQMRAVAVSDHDVADRVARPPHRFERRQHPRPVGVVERVDERQRFAVVEQEGVDAAALPLTEGEDAGRELVHR
jgi:hypothetical protein